MLIQENLTLQQKLEILSDAAKYDVACTSSGVNRKGKKGTIGNAAACGICHSFAADGRCISLLKILMTNACIYDCKYCINRTSNDTVRTYFTPEEICTLTMEFYRRNYIEGLFLSSGILNTPNETMDLLYQTLWRLREVHKFWGYIHVKAIPGADPQYLQMVGHLADRMSVNLEFPTTDGLKTLAPSKTRKRILTPMRQIQNGIQSNTLRLTDGRKNTRQEDGEFWLPNRQTQKTASNTCSTSKKTSILNADTDSKEIETSDIVLSDKSSIENTLIHTAPSSSFLPGRPGSINYAASSKFVPAGQSTQMIIGATPETDYQIMSVSEALYRQFDLKRVFYSGYTALNDDSSLPAIGTPPPMLREHRLYQADWLLRFYGFEASELLSEDKPNFNLLMDPKCDWALRHLEHFPVEVTKADYATLLRIPGVGVRSARRILTARRHGTLDFPALKKFGVVLKRASYFITCNGKMFHPIKLDENYLTNQLISVENKKRFQIEDSGNSYRQLTLFDDFHMIAPPTTGDVLKSAFGQF